LTHHTSAGVVIDADRERVLDILRSNSGFRRPEEWLARAVSAKFERVQSQTFVACPDCGGGSRELGRQVYYSTSMGLRRCAACDLAFIDTRLAFTTTASHFEETYKDDAYFETKRAPVFAQLARLVSTHAPGAGSVLDVGGAKGHLLVRLRDDRPDLRLTLTDISRVACAYAAERHRLRAVHGGVDAIESISERFDVIVLSDVLYYEPELTRLWRVLRERLTPSGTLIIRIPNHHRVIVTVEALKRLFRSARARRMSQTLCMFNSEHLYAFSRRYLKRRLHGLGFGAVAVHPSALSRSTRAPVLTSAWTRLANAAWRMTGGRLALSPSVIVVAQRTA
jgi:predicted TPR repeat methyltransferase